MIIGSFFLFLKEHIVQRIDYVCRPGNAPWFSKDNCSAKQIVPFLLILYADHHF